MEDHACVRPCSQLLLLQLYAVLHQPWHQQLLPALTVHLSCQVRMGSVLQHTLPALMLHELFALQAPVVQPQPLNVLSIV